MEEVQCKTCGSKVTGDISKHLCAVVARLTLKGPMDEGYDICAEVRKFLQDNDEEQRARRTTT